jgi:hypothetical protein
MTPGLLVQFAATTLVVGVMLTLGGMLRGPPERPQRAPPPPAAVATPPPGGWVCVTPRGYCASPPRRVLEPCACLDAWQGWQSGRVLGGAATSGGAELSWPARPAAEEEEPGSWLGAP